MSIEATEWRRYAAADAEWYKGQLAREANRATYVEKCSWCGGKATRPSETTGLYSKGYCYRCMSAY